MSENSEHLVEHLFRTEYGKLVAILTRLFGTSHIQLSEDVVQDTLITALNHWSSEGIPSNPTGWLVQVSKRKAFNELKRNQMIQNHHDSGLFSEHNTTEIDDVFLQSEIEDSQLRMIFTCCHPLLNRDSQIALTLKTLCGFGVREVANALLTSESTVNKRLYRAKMVLKQSKLAFAIPQGKELDTRLETVMLSLYLLFNEGYNSTVDDVVVKKELCLEAMRLTKLLANRFDTKPKVSALLALMCFHTARFDARIDDHGTLVLFEDQDRSLWNAKLINLGIQYMARSMADQELSVYHIEANIAAEHCMAKSFDSTNWQSIYDLYELLAKLKPNPIIQLNLAIVQSKLSGVEASLDLLDKLSQNESLKNYHLLPATQGIFYMKLNRYSKAIDYLEKALKLNPSMAERNFIENKIQACTKKLPNA